MISRISRVNTVCVEERTVVGSDERGESRSGYDGVSGARIIMDR